VTVLGEIMRVCVQTRLQTPYSASDCGLQVDIMKEAIIKVENLALMFVEGCQAGPWSWQ
jgi:hypothetical protein